MYLVTFLAKLLTILGCNIYLLSLGNKIDFSGIEFPPGKLEIEIIDLEMLGPTL